MREYFETWLSDLIEGVNITEKFTIFEKLNLSDRIASIIVEIIFLAIIILISYILYLFTKKILIRILRKIILNSPTKWDNAFLDKDFIRRTLHLIPVIVFYILSFLLPTFSKFIDMIFSILLIFMVVHASFSLLDAINCIYDENNRAAKQRPIKGFLQIVKIFVFVIGFVIVISNLLGQSPLYLLSGLGAMSAVIILIFQNSILGMVAGVQMSSNDLVRIGDWIEMPKYGADGDVIDISLTVVKVENFDRTITTIPAYALVSDSFKNWRGIQNAGGRRIKRPIYIDASTVSFCSKEKIQELKKIKYLEKYLEERQNEIAEYNKEHDCDDTVPVNGRRLTNIGILRAYIKEYLVNHPKIHKGMIIMVRQLAPEKNGIPLEIYAFTNDIAWENYENIMADIFDHLFAVVPYFGLGVFQEPTGEDIRYLKNK